MKPQSDSKTKTPLWRSKGYYKKGDLVRRRRTRHQTREEVDKDYGLGIVIEEDQDRDRSWSLVWVFWQGRNQRLVQSKGDVERVLQKVEQVVLPKRN